MRNPARVQQRGVSTLVVVMVLFFLMLMVAAFASRTLVFEQKTSANQYRSTQAFEAGEAGLQWAMAMLNAGRVDAQCRPTDDAGATTFRERYLSADAATGRLTPVVNTAPLAAAADITVRPGCVMTPAGWRCSCPGAGQATLEAPEQTGAWPAFTVEFVPAAKPGLVNITARGCSSLGARCVAGSAGSSDAYAEIHAVFARSMALRTPPAAALTARGDVDLGGATLRLANADAESRGVTIDAGGAVRGTEQAELFTVAGGRPGASAIGGDASLAALPPGKLFVSFFGVDTDTFKRMPGVQRLRCSADCSTQLVAAYDAKARLLWIDGDLSLDTDIRLGSVADPVLLAVEGNVQLGGTAQLHGVVYSAAPTWNNAVPGSALVRGAALAEGGFTGGGSLTIAYDPEVLARLQLLAGTFTRVPGSWSDFR